MNEILREKNMAKAILAFLIIVSLFFVVKTVNELRAGSYIGAGIYPANTISVSGQGEVNKKPDTASFNFSVTEEALDVETAQTSVSKSISAIIEALEEEGIEEKDIRAEGYNIYPRYEYRSEAVVCPSGFNCYPPEGERTLNGYEVSQSIRVKVRDLNKAGDILTLLGSLGVDNLYGPNFEVEDEEKAVAEARSIAIADAKEKAEKLARELGVRLGRVASFNENGGEYPVYYDALETRALGKGVADEAFPAPLPSGENTVRSSVNIVYEIK